MKLHQAARSLLFITILGFQLLFWPAQTVHAASWLDPAWSSRRSVTITNSGAALSNYQVKIKLNSSFDFATAKAGGADLRFTNDDGTTLLPFWIEAYSAGAQSATIWVKVPSINASSTKTLYLYYGNSAATSLSNGSTTFPFFDDFSNPAWTSLNSMPVDAADLSVATVNNQMYIIGGYNNAAADPLNTNYRFDPATGSYTQRASMPTARWGLISVALGGKIYAFGGQLSGGSGSNANQMYDPATNTWTNKANLPASLAHQGVTGCTDGNKAYLFYDGLTYAYDPATNAYTQRASMPNHVLSWATCSYANGNIYLMGGYDGGAVNYNQIYNIATNTWTTGAPMPFGVYGAVRENPVVNGNIYVVQGQQADSEFSSAAYQYNIATNSWAQKSFGPHAADGVAGGVVNGKIYTFGGRQDGSGPYGLDYAAMYNPATDTNQNWSQLFGNFEVSGGTLHRMTPPRGSISNGPFFSQISSTYSTGSQFVLEAQGTADGGWSTLGVHTNGLSYADNLTGYLLPYNDFGVSPNSASIYREDAADFTQLASASIATGSQRYQIVSTNSNLALYRAGNLIASTNDATYRGGALSVETSVDSDSAWDLLFVRAYAASTPTITLGAVERL